jgi:hypothetical protein
LLSFDSVGSTYCVCNDDGNLQCPRAVCDACYDCLLAATKATTPPLPAAVLDTSYSCLQRSGERLRSDNLEVGVLTVAAVIVLLCILGGTAAQWLWHRLAHRMSLDGPPPLPRPPTAVMGGKATIVVDVDEMDAGPNACPLDGSRGRGVAFEQLTYWVDVPIKEAEKPKSGPGAAVRRALGVGRPTRRLRILHKVSSPQCLGSYTEEPISSRATSFLYCLCALNCPTRFSVFGINVQLRSPKINDIMM